MNGNSVKDKLLNKAIADIVNRSDVMDQMKDSVRPFYELMSIYKCAIMEIETKMNVLDEEFSLDYDRNPIESIKSRLKSPEGILKKATRKNIPFNVSSIEKNINDIAGVRVICSFPKDIYSIANSFLAQDDIRLIEIKDYIKNPKPNGYRSLHLIVEVPIFLHNKKKYVKVEVQLRTIAMDFWASLEHKVHYKKNIPEELELQITNDLKECAEIGAALDKRMEYIKKIISDYE